MMPRWLSLALLGLFTAALAYGYARFVAPLTSPLVWEYAGTRYQLLEPRALGYVLVAPLILLVLYKSLADLPWQQRLLSAIFRIGFIALLALSVSRLVRSVETRRIATVFLVDVSDSVSDAALASATRLVQGAWQQKGAEDEVRVIRFARRPRLVEVGANGEVPAWRDGAAGAPAGAAAGDPKTSAGGAAGGRSYTNTPSGDDFHSESDLQAALQLAYGVFPAGYIRRAVLVSDGIETRGDVLAEAHRAAQFGVKLYTLPFEEPVPAEVAVQNLSIPSGVKVGEPFFVSADVYASRAGTARARLYQGDVLNGLDAVRDVALEPGRNEIKFRSVVRVGGPISYKLDLDQIPADQFAENNHFVTSIDVPGRPTVLYVEGQPGRATYLASALGAQQFDVDVRSPTALPRSLAELERYDFFILSDTPAENVDSGVQDLTERYVRDLGGGFLFAGGVAGYGPGGWNHTSIERLLPVSMDAERQKDMPGVAMSLVIDRSGSMTGLPVEMAKAACRATVETLGPDDLVEVIAFDSQPKRFVKMQPARYSSRIQNEIATIQPGGGTAIFPALDAAYQDISVVQARKKHVILLTDGRADSDGIRDLVGAMIAEGITVTTVGLGDGADADFLRMIAEAGGGRYHHVPDPNSLPRIFTRETEMITRQSAVQEWFPIHQTSAADFLRGIAMQSAPLLHGYVATQMKPAPAQQILASDQGEPILARWRVGLGWSLAWTSDLKNNWAIDWLRWSDFGRFWGQLVREHMRTKHRRELDMSAQIVGGRVYASVDAFGADGGFDNSMESRLIAMGPLPGGERREFPMRQTAPGRYQADFELDGYGSFLLRAEHFKTGEDGRKTSVGVSFGQVSQPYPGEYARLEPDRELLERAAVASGGVFQPPVEMLFDAAGEVVTYEQPLWQRFIVAAMVLFLMDLLMRRVRLFDREFKRGGRRLRGA
jgi:Ca-activated chloride channel family protein